MNNISYLVRRTRAYWFVDGLAEIGSGILFMVLSIPYLLWSLAPQGSVMAKVASYGRDVLLILGIIILFLVIRSVKETSTYPRTGYIEEPKIKGKQILKTFIIALACILVFIALMAIGILFLPSFGFQLMNNIVFIPSLLGLFFTTGYLILALRTDIKRFFILGGIAALTCILLAATSFTYLAGHPIDWQPLFVSSIGLMPEEFSLVFLNMIHFVYQGVAFLCSIIGSAMLVSGLIVRRRYLNQNPSIAEVQNGN